MSLFMLILYSSILVIVRRHAINDLKKLKFSFIILGILYGLTAILSTSIFVLILGAFIEFDIISSVPNEYIIGSMANQIVLAYLFLVFVSPLIEEIFFRKILVTNIEKEYGYKQAVILSSIIFALFHVIMMNGNLIIIILSFLSRFILGYILAKRYMIDRNIYGCYISHAMHNTFLLLGSYL